MKKALQVAALENGTVIDHIPNDKLQDVIRILNLQHCLSSSIMIGFNLESKKMKHKSLIKVSNHYFSDTQINQLSVISSNVTLSIIKDFEVIEKKHIQLPKELHNIISCQNPQCITNNEPMPTLFSVNNKKEGILQCHYCEKEIKIEEAKLVQ